MRNYLLTIASIALVATTAYGDAIMEEFVKRNRPDLYGRLTIIIDSTNTRNDSPDWFDFNGDTLRANSKISAAVGLGRNDGDIPMRASTDMKRRYSLNYCTHSYSMAFWDSIRWNEEIDKMAMQGINMPLAITGSEAVWLAVLRRLGYTDDEALQFIAGPGYQAWWLMNNLEGWGGPVSIDHIERQANLQRHILSRMRSLGMQPVLAGYSGMLPHDAGTRLGLAVADGGNWLGYTRPAFLQPTDSAFVRIANIYYEELTRLYGSAKYYSADPFHEGGKTDGIDLNAAAKAIYRAMERVNPEAVWVIQGWQENPRRQLLEAVKPEAMIVLDLQAENKPEWEHRRDDYALHPWLFCMLHNFGGNIGLYGKIDALLDRYRRARAGAPTLEGIGLTMEGIGTNPLIYALMTELPWLDSIPNRQQWIADYISRRYGSSAPESALRAWQLLGATILNSPADSVQQGVTESVFCARPSRHVSTVSAWANSKDYYSSDSVIQAARLLIDAADSLIDNANFRYDLVDVTRQAIAEIGRATLHAIEQADLAADTATYRRQSEKFMALIALQDSLLSFHPDFRLDTWLNEARTAGSTEADKKRNEWNARTLITVWGNREAADNGQLRDYAHREWSGLLREFYAPRWQYWFEQRLASGLSRQLPEIDWFALEEPWTRRETTTDRTSEAATPHDLLRFVEKLKSEIL